MIRLCVSEPLSAGAGFLLDPDQTRYLTNVMRLKAGDAILAFNGRDGEWRAVIKEVGKRSCLLVPEGCERAQSQPPDLDLVIALVKRPRLETIVEKAAELGVRRVRLAVTRRTNADHTNVGRLQTIAREASEQTGRLDVPDVLAPERLDALLSAWSAERRLMFCDESGDDASQPWGGEAGRAPPALEALARAADGEGGRGPWAILIGPEGGFAPEERTRLLGLPFVVPVSLGPRILRADTAAIAGLTLWQGALGDWKGPSD